MKKILFAFMALVLSLSAPSFSAHAQDYAPDHKILIAYFTWAENTTVAYTSAVDVDATTSASVLMPGNVGLLASWIQPLSKHLGTR